MADLRAYIAAHLPLTPVPGLPGIRLHTAGPASGLGQLIGEDAEAPYWAYPWSGGLVLARYLIDRPEAVRGRRVLDLGAGGGIVAIAAGKAGAATTIASEADAVGRVALALNLEANGVAATTIADVTEGAPPDVDVVLGGDVFYRADVAARMLTFLDDCLAAGIEVLIGDPGRRDLPRDRLERLAGYRVAEVGLRRGDELTEAAVYRLTTAAS